MAVPCIAAIQNINMMTNSRNVIMISDAQHMYYMYGMTNKQQFVGNIRSRTMIRLCAACQVDANIHSKQQLSPASQ